MKLQVDQHVEHLKLYYQGPEDVDIGRGLARKALRPRSLIIDVQDADDPVSAMTSLLATEQHHQLFEGVQSLALRGWLSKKMLQVRTGSPVEL
jgi:hypothetical protein